LLESKLFEDRVIEERIIIKWIFKKWHEKGHGLDWSGSGYGQLAGTCDCGNGPSGSIKCGKFLDKHLTC
jgi:hypothetical protein